MTDIETTVENARAQYHYPPIRTAILPSDADELQLRLADRLHRHRHQHALEVIADLGWVFDAEDAEPAVEALGRLLVHASLLAGCERMAIAPIIALGRQLTRDSGVSSELPLKPAAMLAWAALGRSHDDFAIPRGLAMAIAKAIDDCEIVHELKVDPLELFKVAAREVLDGKDPAVSAARALQPVPVDKAAQRALAWTELRKASETVVADEWAIPTDGGAHPYDREPTAGVGQCRTCGSDDEHDERHIIANEQAELTDASGTLLTDEHLDGRILHAQIVVPAPMPPEGIGPIRKSRVLRVPSPGEPGFAPFDDAAFARRVAQVSGAPDCPDCGAPMAPSTTWKREGGGRLEIEPAGEFILTSDPADIAYLCINCHRK